MLCQLVTLSPGPRTSRRALEGEAADLVLITMEMSAQRNLPLLCLPASPPFTPSHREPLATAHTHARTYKRTCTCTHGRTQARMHGTHIRERTRTQASANIHKPTYTHAPTHSRIQASTHARTHAHTHIPVCSSERCHKINLFQFHSPVTPLSERATEYGSAYSLALLRSICHFFFIQEIQIYFMSCLRGDDPTALCGGCVFAVVGWRPGRVTV